METVQKIKVRINPETGETFLAEKMTWEEYLDFGGEDVFAEWIDGDVLLLYPNSENLQIEANSISQIEENKQNNMYSASTRHQEIVGFLDRVIGIYIEKHNLGRIFVAPYAMKTETGKRGREPDLLFVKRENVRLIEATFLNGAADLVIEIVSPESFSRDKSEKFLEYEKAGVKEYWLIDYERKRAEFYELSAEGFYRIAETGAEKIYRSKVIEGFYIAESWLWQENPPTLEALRELKVI